MEEGKELTSFQKKRLENIKRNNELLRKLNLAKLSNSIGLRDTTHHTPTAPRAGAGNVSKGNTTGGTAKKTKKKHEFKQERPPVRRSRRLQGQNAETPPLSSTSSPELASLSPTPVKLEHEDVKILGDIKLSDIIKDEEKLAGFSSLNISSGDFFRELRQLQQERTANDGDDDDNKDIERYVSMFDETDLYQEKVIYERISALYIHPSRDSVITLAGDISGHIGLWNKKLDDNVAVKAEDIKEEEQEQEEKEEEIYRFQLFGKNISKICCQPNRMERLIAASYDGSVRSIDLKSLKSEEIIRLSNEYDDSLGVSDLEFSYDNPNLLYMTTLSGEFTTIDIRENWETERSIPYRRLADKKIGSMAINPKNVYQIATGSLDRTLKIWDIRKLVDKPEWSQYEDYPSHEIVATYDSRLSVSAVSYSPSGDTLVCNGYDDTIRLFDIPSDTASMAAELEPKLTIKHNCQTGRWTSILKARFKPDRNMFAIANMRRAIDVYTSSGKQLAHLVTATVPAVVSWHPSRNIVAGGNSSGKVFLFVGQDF